MNDLHPFSTVNPQKKLSTKELNDVGVTRIATYWVTEYTSIELNFEIMRNLITATSDFVNHIIKYTRQVL